MKKKAISLVLIVAMMVMFVPNSGLSATVRAATIDTANLSDMRARAEAIVNYEWTPAQKIATWNGNPYNGDVYFYPSQKVKGMPYTLFVGVDVKDNLLSLAQYDRVKSQNRTASNSSRTGPLYGSCCATFVSEVFGGSFMSGENPAIDSVDGIRTNSHCQRINDIKAADIRAGDALSTKKEGVSHIIWVGEVTDTFYVIYEQTPPVAQKIVVDKKSHTDENGNFWYGYHKYNGQKKRTYYDVINRLNLTPVPTVIHTRDTSYGTNFTATAISKQYAMTESHQTLSDHYVDANDVCTIHEVYTDGCCKVTYPAGNTTRTYYFKISNFKWQTTPLTLNLSTQSLTLYQGQSATIEATYSGDEAKYLSGTYENKDICSATKSNIENGKCTITVTGKAGGTTKFSVGLYNINKEVLISKDVTVTVIPCVDLGDVFYANISAYEKNLTNDFDNVSLRSATTNANQIWKFERQSDLSYKIISLANNRCLDVADASSASGANVWTCDSNDSDAQRWFIYQPSGSYILRAKCTDCHLDVNGGHTDDGTNIQMWEMNTTSAQRFSIKKLSAPTNVTFNVNATSFDEGETVQFTFSGNNNPTGYWIGIDKNNTRIITQKVTSPFTISSLEAGSYTAYVTAANSIGSCDSSKVSFTVYPKTNFTPKATVKDNGNTYALYDDVLTCPQAKAKCEELGGHLVTITSEHEQNVVNSLLGKGIRPVYWIGASDTASEGTFQWVTGEPFSYTHWSAGEPNNNGDEDYVHLWNKSDYLGLWNDNKVNASGEKAGFILEIDKKLLSISIDSPMKKSVYNIGEVLDVTGLKVSAHYDDGSQKDITQEIIKKHFSILAVERTAGLKTMVIRYEDKTEVINWLVLNPYTVSYDANGGTGAPEPQEKKYGVDLTLSAQKPARSGFTFLGWAEKADATAAQYQPKETFTGNKNVTLFAVWSEKTVSSITIKKLPAKMTYTVGEKFDFTGMVVKVNYTDGTGRESASGYTYTPSNPMNTAGQQKIVVTYGGKSTGFKVTVNEKTVSSITIKKLPAKMTYTVDEKFDSTGMIVKVNYTDGTSKEITSGYTYTPTGAMNAAGQQKIVVTYGSKSTGFKVTVNDKTVSSITIKKLPKKMTYTVGEKFDSTGMIVKVNYANGTTKEITSGYTYTPTGAMNTVGKQTIAVAYKESGVTKGTGFKVTVNDKTMSSITIKKLPSKMTYTVGEKFDPTGMIVKVNYSDGTTKEITSGYTNTPTGAMNTAGKQTIAVAYKANGVTKGTGFKVTVNEKTVSSISIKKLPSKMTNTAGEKFDPTGMIVKVNYADGTSREITSGYTYTPTGAMNTVGKQTIAVAYKANGVTKGTGFKVTVNEKTVFSISIKKLPKKMTYTAGEKFDPTGMIVKVNYSDGTSREITSGYTYTPTGAMNTAGKQTIAVAYKESGVTKGTGFKVTVE